MKLVKALFIILTVSFVGACCKEDEGYGIFKDSFPVEFQFLEIAEITPTYIHTTSGPDVEFTLPEREAEINANLVTAKDQVTYIKLLGPDQSEIKGKQKDGITEVVLEAKYTQSGKTYKFEKNIFTEVLKYTSEREADTMTMKGISCIRYNNGVRKDRSTVVQVSGYTLEDEKAQTEVGDTLYYRVFDIKLLKKI